MEASINETSRTLWIGDLDSCMDESFLQTLLSTLGYSKELSSIKLIKDKATGLPLKYGFIEFVSHNSANNFYMNYNNRIIPNKNKVFKLNWAAYGGGAKPALANQNKNSQLDIQIYVGDIDLSVTEHKLLQFFRSRYPSAFSAKIITDNVTKLSKGYGFVKFTNHDQAHKAIAQTNGQPLLSKSIKVSNAYMKPKEETQQENQELQGQLVIRQKLYNQFFSMLNDPQTKAQYQRQVLKTFGNQEGKKATLKQSLGEVRSLSYNETLQSEKFLEIIPRTVHNRCRFLTEQKIYI